MLRICDRLLSDEGLRGEMGAGEGLSDVKTQLAAYGVTVEIRSSPDFGTPALSLVFRQSGS